MLMATRGNSLDLCPESATGSDETSSPTIGGLNAQAITTLTEGSQAESSQGRKKELKGRSLETTDDLLLAVETLAVVHDRFDSDFSDSTGTSAGDDGDNKDHNFPGRG
jgi:hypothetical protein